MEGLREDEAGRPRPSGSTERRRRDHSLAARPWAGGARVTQRSASSGADQEASARTQGGVEKKEEDVAASLLSPVRGLRGPVTQRARAR